jgi:hypothetical protein
MTLRRIDSFATSDPEKLADQLSRLEDNISRALSVLDARLSFGDWALIGPVQLNYDQIARINTDSVATAQGATLPSLSLASAARMVGIKKTGAQNVIIEPIESTALIDGAATYTITADGLYLFIQDGETWSRV